MPAFLAIALLSTRIIRLLSTPEASLRVLMEEPIGAPSVQVLLPALLYLIWSSTPLTPPLFSSQLTTESIGATTAVALGVQLMLDSLTPLYRHWPWIRPLVYYTLVPAVMQLSIIKSATIRSLLLINFRSAERRVGK